MDNYVGCYKISTCIIIYNTCADLVTPTYIHYNTCTVAHIAFVVEVLFVMPS